MDFKSYYLNQAENGLPVFQGSPNQKGYGLGGIFRNIFKWVMPIVREHAVPIAKSVGKELLKTATNVAQDTLDGAEPTESLKKRFKESIKNISNRFHEGQGLILKPGLTINSRKRKKHSKKSKNKKRQLDIFDKK